MERLLIRRAVRLSLNCIRSFGLCIVFICFSYLLHCRFAYHESSSMRINTRQFRLGIDTITPFFLKQISPRGVRSYRVGLVTNQSGIASSGKSTLTVLQEQGLAVKKVFVPDHCVPAGMHISPDVSVELLYEKKIHKKFDEQMLKDIDVLMFDVQDVGMRQNSYLKTLLFVIEAAAQYKKTVVIFDRPNLLGSCMEGMCAINQHITGAGYLGIPMRYGLTMGELACYLNACAVTVPARLFVAPMSNYDRHLYAPTTIARLSPNIQTLDSCYGYSFLGLIGEVAPFDIGVGTQKAFQCILLPESVPFAKSKWYELKIILKQMGIDSSLYRHFSARKKQHCFGLRLRIRNVDTFSSFHALITILHFFKTNGVPLRFSTHFDQAIGTTAVRELIEGKKSFETLGNEVNRSLKLFFNKARTFFIYKPIPKVVMV